MSSTISEVSVAQPAGRRPQLHRLRALDARRHARRAYRRHQLRRPARHAEQPRRRRRRHEQHLLRSDARPHRLGARSVPIQPGRGAGIPRSTRTPTPPSTGRAGGAVINVVTKSGTNTPHGTVLRVLSRQGAERERRDQRPQQPAEVAVSLQPVRRQLRRAAPEVRRRLPLRELRRPAEHAAQRRVRQPCRPGTTLDADGTAGLAKVTALGPELDTRAAQNQDVFLVKTDSQLTSDQRLTFRYNHQNFTGKNFENGGAAERARAHRQLRSADPHAQRVVHEQRPAARCSTRSAGREARDQEPGLANSEKPGGYRPPGEARPS